MTTFVALFVAAAPVHAQEAFAVVVGEVVLEGASSESGAPDAIDIGFSAPTSDSVEVVATIRKVTHGLTLKRGVIGFEDAVDWWAACEEERCPELTWHADDVVVVYGRAQAAGDSEWKYIPIRRYF